MAGFGWFGWFGWFGVGAPKQPLLQQVTGGSPMGVGSRFRTVMFSAGLVPNEIGL
jgi:hypothetical protein